MNEFELIGFPGGEMEIKPIKHVSPEPTLYEYMKAFEDVETHRAAVKGKPMVARLDGHGFSNFTRVLEKPFDLRLTGLMRDTTKMLVEKTNANLGYTQSDEISLVWYLPEDHPGQYFFGGRFQKLVGILSSMATGYFIRELDKRIPEKAGQTPEIDARVWQLPTLKDAGKMLLWRERDAMKNSITMYASKHFSHKQLHKVDGWTKRKWLQEKGDPWEAQPDSFRKGSYFKRVTVLRDLTSEELSKIPEGKRPLGLIKRNEVQEIFFPDLNTVDDLEEIFK